MRKLFIILFIILATVFILVNTIDFKVEMPEEYFSKHYALGWTDFDVKCIVIDKYRDSEHHNNPTVVGKDPCSSGYTQSWRAAGADLQSAPFNPGFVILIDTIEAGIS